MRHKPSRNNVGKHMSPVSMLLVAKKTGQINVRIDPALTPALDEIETKFRIGQSELVRGLVEAAVAFYRQNGWFAFPVEVFPSQDFLKAIKETPAPNYRPGPPASQTPTKKKAG